MEKGSRYPSEKTKAAISAKLKGRRFTQQHKDRISAALKQFYSDDRNFNDPPMQKDYISNGDIV